MEEGSQAHAGVHRPSTPPAQVIQDTEEVTPVATQPNSSSTNEHDSDDSGKPKQVSEDDEPEGMPLEAFNWSALDAKFNDDMRAFTEEEALIQQESAKLMNFYSLWQQVPQIQEQERCAKRLRTRMAYVEMQEGELAKKKEHHETVLRAFASALSLLKR